MHIFTMWLTITNNDFSQTSFWSCSFSMIIRFSTSSYNSAVISALTEFNEFQNTAINNFCLLDRIISLFSSVISISQNCLNIKIVRRKSQISSLSCISSGQERIFVSFILILMIRRVKVSITLIFILMQLNKRGKSKELFSSSFTWYEKKFGENL